GIGAWDKVAVRWGYGRNENREAILAAAWAEDLRFMTNQDLDLDPRVDQWAHGTDAAAELQRVAGVRRAALARFGERAIREGTPLALLEEALVPLYLHHRYQLDAAASALGGVSYTYAMRGDGRSAVDAVPAAQQRAALEAILSTLRPAELTLPRSLLEKLPPRPYGFGVHRELFPRHTGSAFDPLTPASVAADLAFGGILQPQRAARLVAQHAVDPALPGLDGVTARLVTFVFEAPATNAYEREVRRSIRWVLGQKLMGLASTAPMPQVRAEATAALRAMRTRATAAGGAFDTMLATEIERFLERPAEPQRPIQPPQIPPGAPIG
ncbi:MAG TPA: zinc-dependent metalloprotease, partial [Thermoanaerobaculia bacterium]|nr:zinc-dependent metalloprotease [Thermoanaerobaculia bacterium]